MGWAASRGIKFARPGFGIKAKLEDMASGKFKFARPGFGIKAKLPSGEDAADVKFARPGFGIKAKQLH